MNALKKLVQVDSRSVYTRGKRPYRVWEARLTVDGQEYRATSKSKSEAVEAVIRDAEYARTAGRVGTCGCSIYAQGFHEWVFVLPSGASMLFGADTLIKALERVRGEYRDHPDCAAFFAATEGLQ